MKKKWSRERESCVRWGRFTERVKEREKERIAGKREVDSDKTRKRMGRPWFAFLYSLAAFFFSLSLSQTASSMYVLITQTHTLSQTFIHIHTYTLKTVAPMPQQNPQLACRTTITSIHSFTNSSLFSSLFLCSFYCFFLTHHIKYNHLPFFNSYNIYT